MRAQEISLTGTLFKRTLLNKKTFNRRRLGFIQRLIAALSACLVYEASIALPAQSADTIYLDHNFFGRALPVSSLELFAETGNVDDELAPYLTGLSSSEKAGLQQLLSTTLPSSGTDSFPNMSDPFVLSQWLHSPIGSLTLATFGKFIQTRSRRSGHQALRAAIILAAADSEGLSLINVIRLYPTGGLRLNLPQLLALVNSIGGNFERTERLVTTTIERSAAAAALEASLNYGELPMIAKNGQFNVVKRTLLLNDQRQDGLTGALRDRTYPVDLYLPEDLDAISGPIPVMVFSHGYSASRSVERAVSLARSLAANGFVVAVPEHVGSNKDYQRDFYKGLIDESFDAMTFINRPLDIKFLLDTLEQKNDEAFQGRLQLDQVGIIGHSLGGYTALALAGATVDVARLQQQCDPETNFTLDTVNLALLIQCRALELGASLTASPSLGPVAYERPTAIQQLTDGSLRDDRVGLVIALAPLSSLFGPQGIENVRSPVVIMGGAYDMSAPIALEQLSAFQWLTTEHKYFYITEHLAHTAELTRIALDIAHPEEDAVDRFNTFESELLSLTESLIIAHGKVHLQADESYRPYLTSAYVRAVSMDPNRIHLLRSFSDGSPR
ncbi:MAG: alpha/beta hydrolase [Cyanobacteria bacterium J06631_12]